MSDHYFFLKKIIPEYKIIHWKNSEMVGQQMCLANNDAGLLIALLPDDGSYFSMIFLDRCNRLRLPPMHQPMHGIACPLSQTPIRPNPTYMEQDYMILLLGIWILLRIFTSNFHKAFFTEPKFSNIFS